MTRRTVNCSQKNKSYVRIDRGIRLAHDGATFHTARKNYLAIQIIDLNQIDHICPISGTLSAVQEGSDEYFGVIV